MSDSEVVWTVTSWAIGCVVLLVGGLAIPLMSSFVPDAIAGGCSTGQWKPLGVLSALLAGLLVLAVWEGTYTGAPGTPSSVVWGSLTVLLALATSIAAGGSTITRALKRRAERRRAIAAVMRPTTHVPEQSDTSESKPPPARMRVNAREAEHLACAWMKYLGAEDAVVTPERRDGGVDVRSRDYVVQVKNFQSESVGVPLIRQLNGIAAPEGRRAVFFSSSGYSRDATAFAREVGMALFIFRARPPRSARRHRPAVPPAWPDSHEAAVRTVIARCGASRR